MTLVYQGMLDDRHLRAVIRLALRAHGFTTTAAVLDAAGAARWQLGCWLRDQALPERFPPFVHISDYRGIAEEDPHLWGYLPHMFAFGYEQAVVLHGLAPVSPEVDAAVAMLGAAFSAGIALLDYLVDEHAQGAILFEALNRDMVRRIFEPGDEQDAAFARTYEQFTDPRIRLLIALITTCRAGLHDLHRLSGNDVVWVGLAEMINQLYEAERTVSSATTSREEIRSLLPALETKSVLPFVVMQQISALATSQPKDPARGRHASATLGRIVWLVDDLVDLLADYRRNAPNAAVLRLADLLAERGRTRASDADIYDVVDATVTELVALLQPDAFEIRPTTNDQRPTTDFIHQTHGKAVTGHSSESLRSTEVYRIPAERDEGKADLATVLDFARLTVARWVGWQEETTEGTSTGHTGHRVRVTERTVTRAAAEMLLLQQREGLREAIHYLRFPRVYGEEVHYETHPALLFQRAIVLDALLDAEAAGVSVPGALWAQVLDVEAFAILRAKHHDVRGGWSYIPEVPELPPDADDLGMVLQVLCRLGGPPLASTCDEAIRLALEAAGPDGGFPTWILDPHGHSPVDQAVRAYIDVIGGRGVHPDVVSNLLYGLILYDLARYSKALLGAVPYLEATQDERGAWRSKWYVGPYYGTYRVVSVLGFLAPGSRALARARAFLVDSQRPDGGWGDGNGDPLSTAFAILALTAPGMHVADGAVERGVRYLCGTQEADGGWPPSPFISFLTKDGVETYASRTITTAFCLKALLAAVAPAPPRGYPGPADSRLLSTSAAPAPSPAPHDGWN